MTASTAFALHDTAQLLDQTHQALYAARRRLEQGVPSYPDDTRGRVLLACGDVEMARRLLQSALNRLGPDLARVEELAAAVEPFDAF